MKRLFYGFVLVMLLMGGGYRVSAAADANGQVDPRVQSTIDAVDRGLGRMSSPPAKEPTVPSTAPDPAATAPIEGIESEPPPPSVEEEKDSSVIGTGRYFALVIGIDRYRKLPKLENAVNDAVAIGRILKDDYGFNIRTLLDKEATRDNIMLALNDLRRQLTEKDSLLIYYSGHGEYYAQTETSYWLPVDADRDDTTRWLDSQGIAVQLKLLTSMHVLVVADSCFSGTITRSAGSDISGKRTRSSYLKKVGEKSSRVLIASGGNEPVIDSGGKGHSVFADALITALSRPFDKVFTAEELMARHLKESVAGRAEQLPEYKVIRNSGHEGGDFVFVKKR